ncbi:MAG TPA: histidine phosphatase family protein [Fimbriimonadaceae bacterium]|nr:histidine phosphatase family protein [Fimbriimonadaceae bacterium]
MRLFLIRHGQTAWNAEGRAQGQTDIGLDEGGLVQVEQLAHAFSGERLGEIWSSDLLRARETAEPVAAQTGARLRLDPRLRERTFGEWEGLPFELIARKTHELHSDAQDSLDVQPPRGESVRHVWERLAPVAEAVFSYPRDLAIVTHGGSGALLLARLLKGTLQTARAFRFGNTAITQLTRRPEGLFLMERYNDLSHLLLPARQGDLDGAHR